MRGTSAGRLISAGLTGALVLAIAPPARAVAGPGARCAAMKLRAAVRKVGDKGRCHAMAIWTGAGVEAACLARAERKFAAAFAGAEARGGCATAHDAVAVEALADAALAGLLGALPNTTTTSTSTTTSTAPAALCGNAVREPGEQCDGGAYCTANCTLTTLAPGCCETADGCHAADGFSLNYYMYSYCLSLGGAPNVPGGVCRSSGSCDILTLDPVPLCCEASDGTCSNSQTVNNTAALWSFFNYCEGASLRTSHTVAGATCGPAHVCEPS